ncbi:hypothetical protein ACVRZC_06290 [Streptococcus hyointestinalis]|uniref:Uncharacterized protein n=1 Tax=Streptococcus hyointestinalis TaxID=1337 RepID=A0A380K0L0_9STRE|nr:hypothetical protein [Streptococcus hyointestinalis]SUN58090.1 Uncharacterised protein [Streptococcus hyointestinalis]
MEYKLSVFINNLAFSNKLIIEIYSLLNEKKLSNIWIKKSIQRGHHIEIYSPNLSDLKELESFLAKSLKNYAPVTIEESKLKKQIMTVSSVENTEADLDIQPDGTLLLEEIKTSTEGSSLSSPKTVLAVEEKKMELILYLEKIGFFNKSESQQNILLTKLFLNLGLLFNNNLKMGYLSMKSNILFFNLQLQSLKDTKYQENYEHYYHLVNSLSSDEQIFIHENIETFLEENEDSYFKVFVEELYQFFTDELEKGHLYYQNMSDAESFLQWARENGQLTEFHKNFFTNRDFLSQHSSIPFALYRYTVDVLYQIVPLLNVNPLRKQKITKMVCDKVETGYDITWEDSYAIMQKLFKKRV